ncbi:MAG: hypothetical protein DDT33_01293 [Firmicutes bacterium]|nr:hypothetical protein [Bacillota bacterium]
MKPRIFTTAFSSVYSMYVQKAEKKDRKREEVDTIICWLTGYDVRGLQLQIENEVDFETFYAEAPQINPNAEKITGVVCGIRVEQIDDPLMQKIRWLDKLVDELAKGKAIEKILRDSKTDNGQLLVIRDSSALDVLDESLYSYENAVFTLTPVMQEKASYGLFNKIERFIYSVPAMQKAADSVKSKTEYIPLSINATINVSQK